MVTNPILVILLGQNLLINIYHYEIEQDVRRPLKWMLQIRRVVASSPKVSGTV